MPTRKTIFWLLAAAILYLIALNVGSGWLYIVTALLVAYPLMSLFISAVNVRGVAVSQLNSASASQGDSLPATLIIVNKSHLPRFFLALECGFGGARASFLVPYLPGRSESRIETRFSPLRRGVYPGAALTLTSSAPLGMARRRRRLETETPLAVYPYHHRLPAEWATGLRSAGYLASSSLPTRSSSSDYLGVRDYRPEDSPRSIHWRTTARMGSLAVVEYARVAAITPVVIVDRFSGAVAGSGEESSFELAVTVAASLLAREAASNRRFGIGGSPAEAASNGLSQQDAPALLWLAGVQPEGSAPLDFGDAALQWPNVTPVVVVTSHQQYGRLDESALIDAYPHSTVIMLDGRQLEPDAKRASRFLDAGAIESLAARIEGGGGRFALIGSAEEVPRCLESL